MPTKDVSPTPFSELEPAWMETDDQTTPAAPAGVDTLDESPPSTTSDSEDMSMVTSSLSVVEPAPDVPTERPQAATPVSIPSTPPPPSLPPAPVEAVIATPPPAVKVVIAECPPASALFDNELA